MRLIKAHGENRCIGISPETVAPHETCKYGVREISRSRKDVFHVEPAYPVVYLAGGTIETVRSENDRRCDGVIQRGVKRLAYGQSRFLVNERFPGIVEVKCRVTQLGLKSSEFPRCRHTQI